MTCAYAAVGNSVTLGYTTDDDGVHLMCPCGWDLNLGFRATPQAAIEASIRHKRTDPADEILEIVAELYDSENNDRYGAICDRLIAAEDRRRSGS